MKKMILLLCLLLVGCVGSDSMTSTEQKSTDLADTNPYYRLVYPDNTEVDQMPGQLFTEVEQMTGTNKISCGWDRCGESGGYVCTPDSGPGICLWQRNTWYFQCSTGYCLDGGTSCYRCKTSPWFDGDALTGLCPGNAAVVG